MIQVKEVDVILPSFKKTAHLFENMCVLKWQAVIDEIHAKRMCGFQAIRYICIIVIKIIIIS